MANQDKLDERYLAMAKEWSKMSHAKRKKVGCFDERKCRFMEKSFEKSV